MSRHWSFYSFEGSRWQEIFGGQDERAAEAIVESITWDDQAWDDVAATHRDTAERIARRIATSGFSYAGLSMTEARLLDEITVGFFYPEGLEECLGFAYESPEGLHLKVVKELLARAHGEKLLFLELLTTGRRMNGKGAPDPAARYLILSPEEVSRFRAEVAAELERPAPWCHPAVPQVVRAELLDVLASAEGKNRWLAGRHC